MELIFVFSFFSFKTQYYSDTQATTWKIISELKATSINASLPIAAVLHQPSDKVFQLFTTLLLMARGGNVIYHGPCDKAVQYFSTRGFQK